MSSGAAQITLYPDHRSGTTWRGFHLFFEDYDETVAPPAWVPRDLTDYAWGSGTNTGVHAQFRDESGALLMDLHLGTGISIPDPTDGKLIVSGPGVLTASPGVMSFDIKLITAGGDKRVDLAGTQVIEPGVTVEVAP